MLVSDIPSDGGEFLLDWGAYPGSYVTDHIFRIAFYGTELKIWIEGNDYLNHPNNLIYDFSEDLEEILDNWVKITAVYNIGQSKLFINGSLILEVVENFMEEDDAYTIFDQIDLMHFLT